MKYRCPICETDQPASHFSCNSGSQGGKAAGPSKARTSEQARAAVAARWAKHKAKIKVTSGKTKTSRPRKPAKVSDE